MAKTIYTQNNELNRIGGGGERHVQEPITKKRRRSNGIIVTTIGPFCKTLQVLSISSMRKT
jgi:hypothetical protein